MRLLFVAMLATFPCPSFFVFCGGLLPATALGLEFVNFAAIAWRDPAALVFVVAALLNLAVFGVGLYWLARFLSHQLSSRGMLGDRRAWIALMAIFLILAVLPVYSFDCMDGAPLQWCNWYDLHLGWFRRGAACGDFHW